MNEIENHDEEVLRERLARVQETQDRLEGELRGVDAELEELAGERTRYELLQEVCGGLEKLRSLGAEELFWTGAIGESGAEAHLRQVRSTVDEFHARVGEVEARRKSICEGLQLEEESSEGLEYELFEIELLEEQRKLEWVTEREFEAEVRLSVMPWSRGGEDDKRFRKSLAASLLLSVLLGLLLPLVDVPVPDHWAPVEVPERLTRLIKEAKPPPPPPPPPPEEKLAQESSEQKSDEPKMPEKASPKPDPQKTPKKSAETKGILAFRDKFSGLAESKPPALLGAKARINRSGEKASGLPERSLVATSAPGSSGGINLAALSRNVGGDGGDGIAGVDVGQQTSSIGAIAGPERPLSGGPGPARTDEEIQIVFDRHKAALYRLYNRELRRDPTLKGQMVLRMTIEPDGSVSLCEVKSTDMSAPKLGTQVVSRVKTFDFGAKEGVPAVTILYPIDFLPAT